MKNFIKNHFKFIVTILFFTYLLNSYHYEHKKDYYEIIQKIETTDRLNKIYIGLKIDEVSNKIYNTGKVIYNESILTKAHIYTFYVEVIQCLNKHKEFNEKPWEIYDLKEVINGFNKLYDETIKKEKENKHG